MKKGVLDPSILLVWKEIDPHNWLTLVTELTEVFNEVAPLQMKELNRAWTERDYLALEKSAHALKSTCGNIGSEEIRLILQDIEVAAREKDELQIQRKMQSLPDRFSETKEELAILLKSFQAA